MILHDLQVFHFARPWGTDGPTKLKKPLLGNPQIWIYFYSSQASQYKLTSVTFTNRKQQLATTFNLISCNIMSSLSSKKSMDYLEMCPNQHPKTPASGWAPSSLSGAGMDGAGPAQGRPDQLSEVMG